MTGATMGSNKRRGERTVEQARLLKLLGAHSIRMARAQARVDELWAEREDLYIAARDLDPQTLFTDMAQAVGISEAAVMQMHKRAVDKRAAKTV